MNPQQRDVLDFWFRELTPKDWFEAGERNDPLVRERFGALLEQARSGALDDWAETPLGTGAHHRARPVLPPHPPWLRRGLCL